MTIGKKTYTMKLDGSDYKFGKKTVKKEKFTELYQALQSIMLDSEVEETKDAADKERSADCNIPQKHRRSSGSNSEILYI